MPSVLQVVCSTVSAGLGVVFNGYILFVLLWNRRIQTANRVLLLHLAFVDTVFCLVILLYNTSLSALATTSGATYSLSPEQLSLTLSDAPPSGICETHGFVWTLLPVVVVWTVCGLSCDRYAAISTPLHYSRLVNTRRAFFFVLASWIVGATLALPPLMGVCPYTFWDARWACAATCTAATRSDLGYALAYVVLAIIIPVAIILICNLHILMIARYHRHRIVAAIYEVTLRAQATVIHQRNPCYLSKFKGRSAFFTIAQLVGSLVVLTIPYFSVLVWEAANGRAGNAIFVSMATILLTCTPPVNAYVYGVKSRVLRQTLKRLLQRHLYQQEVNRRFSEIFSDPSRRPPLLRRVSAPAGYCRKLSQEVSAPSNSRLQLTECGHKDQVSHSHRPPKHVFTRSSSLPVAELCMVSPDPSTNEGLSSSKPLSSEESALNTSSTSLAPVHCDNKTRLAAEPTRRVSAPAGSYYQNPDLESGALARFNVARLPGNVVDQTSTSRRHRRLYFCRSCSFPVTQYTPRPGDEHLTSRSIKRPSFREDDELPTADAELDNTNDVTVTSTSGDKEHTLLVSEV